MDSRSADAQARPDVSGREARVRAAVAGTLFGTGTATGSIEWVTETGSTNRDLMARVAEGAPHGTVLVTDHQTAGRGTKGRTWFDPPGGSLLVSVLLRPALAPSHLGLTTMAVALAASAACEDAAGVKPGLKWPNDLVAGDRKLAGILAESVLGGGGVEAVVVGMGMNVNWPADPPAEVAALGVALSSLAGSPVDREELLICLLRRLHAELAGLGAGAEELLSRYRMASATIGRLVRVELPSATVTGTAMDVTDAGHLVVEVDGERVTFAAGDVTHLRPA